ncbi:peroxiredoxin-like family protein [Coraliomargarita akajimensis]|uniref:thioredoxin-dependent peroxiredoxin n=1 Tax=Coraliomargarita akajimensis (strain DSM 45221 / IAM 15411 / JCM 23193 / KCTC 12865 / 04OKA010-24) TaxID=583355 RepID=D5EHK6_CORAD|nr:redoxin domain-containing protein [Coraliomargarita akajimensis]ADE54047.1 alkyl hydroperoxide reductase/ Thiol specific antioxidant/ Mal allergen [Coraliomargarita akajimensis DSM 45221]
MRRILIALSLFSLAQLSAESNLQTQLDQKKASSPIDAATRATMQAAIDDLAQTQIVEKAVQRGQKAPDFTAPKVDGDGVFTLSEALKDGPVVLVYYRGDWCPYCNVQLMEYDKHVQTIQSHGAQLVAISPQTVENRKYAGEANPFSFGILMDPDNRIARSYGIAFELPAEIEALYTKFGFDLHIENGSDRAELPLAATYVIDTKGTVVYSFLDADYTKRAEPDAIIEVLKEL